MGSNKSAAKIPKITSAMLFPKRSKAMKLDSLLKKSPSIFPLKVPFAMSNSTRKRLDEINAISIPEKNAENKSVTIITMTEYSIYNSTGRKVLKNIRLDNIKANIFSKIGVFEFDFTNTIVRFFYSTFNIFTI